MHQFDLLYMPSDTLYGSKYKYILAGIDAASRYKVARPLRTKQALRSTLKNGSNPISKCLRGI